MSEEPAAINPEPQLSARERAQQYPVEVSAYHTAKLVDDDEQTGRDLAAYMQSRPVSIEDTGHLRDHDNGRFISEEAADAKYRGMGETIDSVLDFTKNAQSAQEHDSQPDEAPAMTESVNIPEAKLQFTEQEQADLKNLWNEAAGFVGTGDLAAFRVSAGKLLDQALNMISREAITDANRAALMGDVIKFITSNEQTLEASKALRNWAPPSAAELVIPPASHQRETTVSQSREAPEPIVQQPQAEEPAPAESASWAAPQEKDMVISSYTDEKGRPITGAVELANEIANLAALGNREKMEQAAQAFLMSAKYETARIGKPEKLADVEAFIQESFRRLTALEAELNTEAAAVEPAPVAETTPADIPLPDEAFDLPPVAQITDEEHARILQELGASAGEDLTGDDTDAEGAPAAAEAVEPVSPPVFDKGFKAKMRLLGQAMGAKLASMDMGRLRPETRRRKIAYAVAAAATVVTAVYLKNKFGVERVTSGSTDPNELAPGTGGSGGQLPNSPSPEAIERVNQALNTRTVEILGTEGAVPWEKAEKLYGRDLATPRLIQAVEFLRSKGVNAEWVGDPLTNTNAFITVDGSSDIQTVWAPVSRALAEGDQDNFFKAVATP